MGLGKLATVFADQAPHVVRKNTKNTKILQVQEREREREPNRDGLPATSDGLQPDKREREREEREKKQQQGVCEWERVDLMA